MPTYEYECTACKTRFERVQRFTDPPVAECPECGAPVRKVFHPAGVVFKGSGWYITDSRKSTPSESSSSDTKSSDKSSDSPASKTETKTETKAESKSESSTSSSSTKTETAPAAKS